MAWYKFEKGKTKGQLKVGRAQVCWYDMTRGGSCFDESFVVPDGDDRKTLQQIGMMLTYVETDPSAKKCDKSRVFIHMDDGSVYELEMRKLSEKQWQECGKFDGGRETKRTKK